MLRKKHHTHHSALIGASIPDRTLEVFQQGEIRKIKLSDYKGRWLILFFYPADFTFVCPTELEQLAEIYSEFQKEDAEIISISTDSIYTHKVWHEQSKAIQKVHFPMASDHTGSLSKSLGIYIEEEGVSHRATFILDPDSKVRAYEINDNGFGRSAKELLRKLRAAIYVRKNPHEVCPGGWTPGDKTIKPELKLIGNI